MLDLESALHRAVENDELRVVYQAQVDAQTGEPVAVEALVRWEHPTLGLLSPATFLPIAEESGLIVEMDGWVRRRALAQIRKWADAGHPLRLALNLSTRELRDPDLARAIAADIRHVDLDPENVELEITDRIVLPDEELAVVVQRLRGIGVRLAIDDFGTGTSVLRRLTDYKIHTLKIDRSFVRQIDPVSDEAPVIRALLSLAHSFGLEVVAEGVETPSQAGALRRLGCDLIQGYLFGRPVDADTFARSFFTAGVVLSSAAPAR
jgi:EAL domain-containing protein (putative c-di-GMP-specific phosphodiesterase class I)